MNEPSVAKFAPTIRPGGALVVNSSLVAESIGVPDRVRALRIPCNQMALDLGDGRLASMVAIGAYVELSRAVPWERLEEALSEVLPERARDLIPINLRAIEAGRRFALNGSN